MAAFLWQTECQDSVKKAVLLSAETYTPRHPNPLILRRFRDAVCADADQGARRTAGRSLAQAGPLSLHPIADDPEE